MPPKATAQKYVDRFCFYLDQLLETFESQPDKQRIRTKYATRALFLALKLGLIEAEYLFGLQSQIFGQDGWNNFSQGEIQDQDYLQRILDARENRKSLIKDFQAKARTLKTEGLKLDGAGRRDHSDLQTDVDKLCEYIDEMIEIWDIGRDNPEVHRFGRKANKLAVKLGLSCRDRELAAKAMIANSGSKLPYVEGTWSNWTLDRNLWDSTTRLSFLRNWQERARRLLETKHANLGNGHDASPNDVAIPAERMSPPMSLKTMVEFWGGDMTTKKLRQMINNGHIKVKEINRQTFIFDTLLLPAHVKEKIKH